MSITPTPQTETDTAQQMERYGITRVPADQYQHKTNRYSNLGDAVAQARRDRSLNPEEEGTEPGQESA